MKLTAPKRELALLATFISIVFLISGWLVWKLSERSQVDPGAGESVLFLAAFGAPTLLIAIWRLRGALASIPLGWITILLINKHFPHKTWEEIEFAEDWHVGGLIIMTIWSGILYVTITAIRALVRWWRRTQAEPQE